MKQPHHASTHHGAPRRERERAFKVTVAHIIDGEPFFVSVCCSDVASAERLATAVTRAMHPQLRGDG